MVNLDINEATLIYQIDRLQIIITGVTSTTQNVKQGDTIDREAVRIDKHIKD